METKFKDVAHLYLGCEAIRTDYKQRVIWDMESVIHFERGDYKPILRPLSDMTKEEMIQLYFVVFGKEFCGDNITHRDVGKKNERWVLWSGLDRLFIYKDGDVGADSDLQSYAVNQPMVLIWMLKRGFDLFNLIESGQAIDKTIINQPAKSSGKN